jgi:hypothetical protein
LKRRNRDVSVLSTRTQEVGLMQSTTKRQYTTPQLAVHGTLEEVTKQQNKTWGATDGFLFQGASITNVS